MRRWRRRALVVVGGGLGLVALAGAFGPAPARPGAAAPPAAAACSFPFRAAVASGPDAGLAVAGRLRLSIDAGGGVTGTLVRPDGTALPMVGQATGRTLTVLVALDRTRRLSGVGTADAAIRGCGFGTILGPLAGPDLRDLGAWSEEKNHDRLVR